MTTITRDVVYARPTGFRPLSLDLYRPDDPTALCLYLHGGGWRAGSRREGPGVSRTWAPSFFEKIAELGVAVASIDYRLSGEAHYPAQQEDVLAAHAFLAEHVDVDLGPALARTAVWGVSAGGQLAAVHALLPADRRPPVHVAICWYSPTDLDALSRDVDETGQLGDRSAASRESQLVGGPLDERSELVRAASAVHHVRTHAPPFLFLHGNADVSVPPRQSQRLASALVKAGGRAEVELIPAATHMFPELDDAATMRLLRRSVDFLLTA